MALDGMSSLCTPSMWGSGQDIALVALGTPEQRQAWLPLAASGQAPLSPHEVAAELFSHRIHSGGILGKRGRAAVGRVGVSSRAEALLCAGVSMRIRGAAAAWGWLTRQVFLKSLCTHAGWSRGCLWLPCRDPWNMPAQNIGVCFVLWIFQCKAPVFPTRWRGCWLISPGWRMARVARTWWSLRDVTLHLVSQEAWSMEQRAVWECCQLLSLLPALFNCVPKSKGSAPTSRNAKALLLFDQDSPGHLSGMSA